MDNFGVNTAVPEFPGVNIEYTRYSKPLVFPGNGTPSLIRFRLPVAGLHHFPGRPLLPHDQYFDYPVTMSNSRGENPTAGLTSHVCVRTVTERNNLEVTLCYIPSQNCLLEVGMDRHLQVPADVKVLIFHRIPWMDTIPSFSYVHGPRMSGKSMMSMLVRLHVSEVPLTTLPTLAPLVSLLSVTLEELVCMSEFPVGVACAPKLNTLALLKMVRLTQISPDFVNRQATKLTRLRGLCIDKCPGSVVDSLSSLVDLESLQISDVTDSRKPMPFPDVSHMTALRTLIVEGNDYLFRVNVPLHTLTALTSLRIEHCGLKELPPDISTLVALKHLSLKNVNIRSVDPAIASLTSLCSLQVQDCTWLVQFPDDILRNCTKLRHLSVRCEQDASRATGWQMVSQVPYMRNLFTIKLQFPLNTDRPEDDHSSALVHALRCWPPHFLSSVEVDHGFWSALSLHGNDDDDTHDDDNEETSLDAWKDKGGQLSNKFVLPAIRAFAREYRQRRAAFAMGQHHRLGAISQIRHIDASVAMVIVETEFALHCKAFADTWCASITKNSKFAAL